MCRLLALLSVLLLALLLALLLLLASVSPILEPTSLPLPKLLLESRSGAVPEAADSLAEPAEPLLDGDDDDAVLPEDAAPASAGESVSSDVAVLVDAGAGVAESSSDEVEPAAQYAEMGLTRSAMRLTPVTVQSSSPEALKSLSACKQDSLAHTLAITASVAGLSDANEYPESLEHTITFGPASSDVSAAWLHSFASDGKPTSAAETKATVRNLVIRA